MERDELAAWLRLTLTPGVGPVAARRLLAAFGLPQNIFEQGSSALRQVVTPAQAWALLTPPEALAAQLDATWAWLHTAAPEPPDDGAAMQRAVYALGDPGYPRALLDLDDPPLLLYALGQLRPVTSSAPGGVLTQVAERAIAIVGSRNPTAQGVENARQFARALGQAGWTVVSGLALGVDAAAHAGALDAAEAHDSGGCATLAVVGTGLDRVYPRQHLALARRIACAGVLLSEYPLGTPPTAANFPRRNRLIAALSRGTLVVEAALGSGSLITAKLAAEQGREVFAIPGSIHSSLSRGCHALIRQGAKLVESATDILDELDTTDPRAGGGSLDRTARASDDLASDDLQAHGHDGLPAASTRQPACAVLDALGHDPLGLDALLARTGLDAAALQARLLELELDGAVARLPGGLFQRVARA